MYLSAEECFSLDKIVKSFEVAFRSYVSTLIIKQFIYNSIQYQTIRNNLSHPASSKITNEEAKDVITYIRKVSNKLEENYYWYIPKVKILQSIAELVKSLNKEPVRINNLNEIEFHRKNLLYRECELSLLREYIVGNSGGYYRRSGSVVLYGYGGVGKTALVFEFLLRLIKDVDDKVVSISLGFIIFFSSKEEILSYAETNGRLYINPIRKQVVSFEEYKRRLFNYLDISNWEEFIAKNMQGIVVIDNFETFNEKDKDELHSFIRTSPREIQYILTSRNEEKCDDKIYVEEFNEKNNGIQFIDDYIVENGLDIEMTSCQKLELIRGTRGNTLIIILALERLHSKKITIRSILDELSNVSNHNSTIIADFMYKNTFNQTIVELEEKDYNPLAILRAISLYDEPIDIYSISTLSNIKVSEVEAVCNFLSTKLVLNKSKELFTLNEFANKFIFIKFMPNTVELQQLRKKIDGYKTSINENLATLERLKNGNPLLKDIMDDWKPRNYIDQIAISEAFNLFSQVSKVRKNCGRVALKEYIGEINKKFEVFEMKTAHPYVKFQKARILTRLFGYGVDSYLTEIVNDCYEQAILSIQNDYDYIQYTKSYASILWLYGLFFSSRERNYSEAIKYLEQSKERFEELRIFSSNYCKMLSTLSQAYIEMYKSSLDLEYIKPVIDIYFLLKGKTTTSFDVIKLRNTIGLKLEELLVDK